MRVFIAPQRLSPDSMVRRQHSGPVPPDRSHVDRPAAHVPALRSAGNSAGELAHREGIQSIRNRLAAALTPALPQRST